MAVGLRDSSRPLVSVIVPVRNAGTELGDLVAALDDQTLPASMFEVIVVDDGSTDGCVAALPPRPWLHVLRQPPRNSYAARNRGCAYARGAILAFTDADCRPLPQWLEEGVTACGGADLVAGHIDMPTPARATVWTWVEADDYRDQEFAIRHGGGETANLFVRRGFVDRVGGFDETLPSGGDYDLVRRVIAAGGRAAYSRDAVVLHDPKRSAAEYLKTQWRRYRAAGFRSYRSRRLPGVLLPAPAGADVRRARLARYLHLVAICVPVVPTIRERRGLGRPLVPAPRSHAGVRLGIVRRTVGLAVVYCLLPWWRETARRRGWFAARRDARRAVKADEAVFHSAPAAERVG